MTSISILRSMGAFTQSEQVYKAFPFHDSLKKAKIKTLPLTVY